MEASRDLVVVKLGGTTIAQDEALLAEIGDALDSYTFVVVHGGGRTLTQWLEKTGVDSEFVNGLRSTSDAALDVALAVLGGLVNGELVASLRAAGVDAVGLTGIDGGLLRAERRRELGRVGRVTSVRTELLELLISAGFVPVVAPLALDEAGDPCNVNADEAASALAAALGARLVLLTDTDGVLDAAGQRIAEVDRAHAADLVERGVIASGMLPKVTGAFDALNNGAVSAVIADGRAPRALERALTDEAFGTRVGQSR